MARKQAPKPFGGHEVGHTYWCNYWRTYYTVLECIGEGTFGWSVRCKWADGHKNVHSTCLDSKDKDVTGTTIIGIYNQPAGGVYAQQP